MRRIASVFLVVVLLGLIAAFAPQEGGISTVLEKHSETEHRPGYSHNRPRAVYGDGKLKKWQQLVPDTNVVSVNNTTVLCMYILLRLPSDPLERPFPPPRIGSGR